MKLNEKGLLKILNACYVDEDYDEYVLRSLNRKENLFEIQDTAFEQDDFQDVVILTLDEAKDVLHSLNCTWSRCPLKAECKDLVKKKIKQAEGS